MVLPMSLLKQTRSEPVKHPFSIFAVSVIALAAGFGTLPASAENASNGYPYCSKGSVSDPDGDGWGWELQASCVVRSGRADPKTSVSIDGKPYAYCSKGSASDPDGDGWGWEQQASCVVRSSRADPNAGRPATATSAATSTVKTPTATSQTGSTASSATVTCPPGASCGAYAIAGLGSRKQQIIRAGGSVLDLAVAMLESDPMQATYAYGDYKSGDAANFGIFKQNWQMIRTACSQFSGQNAGQWNNGAALNSHLSADVACLHQSQHHYSLTLWFAGHRNGASGLAKPSTPDINAYKKAVYWIRDQLNRNPANLSNNTRFWVNVPAI